MAPESRRRLRALAAALPAALLGALILAPAASAGWFLPESAGSPNADAIRTLYILIALIGLVIFVGVEGLLIYSLIRFRARKGRVAAQIHGNTQLEIGWTVGAAAILIFLTVFTFVLLGDIKDPAASQIDSEGNPIASNATFAALDQSAPPEGSAAMTIKVVGEQYAWSYFYPQEEDEEQVFAYNDMYVPIGMTVILEVQAKDVAHSWWIPALGGKADAIPGYTNKTWFQIPLDALEEGEDRVIYEGQCAELCGRNHADMIAKVIGLPYDDWVTWRDQKAEEIQAAQEAAAAEREEIEASEGGE
ncbi:MAG: cytochrome c oxidase subunit II [Actinomycetota bacterium]|nr:cytochrome c oxidase subunit II [Actinomycetota bacterium]